SLYNTVATL
nr:Chain C, GAG PEPTIDE [synthetic construct]1T22_C Chain C, GAG PEPTIDE [synthetic construct]2V2W_C Chain C, HIV P17 [Human immunodeficiency virus]2V2W_F Chain F, HIV P17 [Human immunodeficiency virus]5NME_C Chain C, Gag protein [Human immunodeficiency virus 1]5NME_H Chain H, Gag protein [Human immunodeficiency virus 1]